MRIWDISPQKLCRNHLLGEHRELHAIWNILTKDKVGYSKHPETLRWKGKLKALFRVHEVIVFEMKRRGYKHNSPLDHNLAVGSETQDIFVDSLADQVSSIKSKHCACKV